MHNLGPIFYVCTDVRPKSNQRPLAFDYVSLTTRPREQTIGTLSNVIKQVTNYSLVFKYLFDNDLTSILW